MFWGAGIALVASLLGGALTTIVGPWLARGAEEGLRKKRVAEDERNVVREAIRDATLAQHEWLDGYLRRDRVLREKGKAQVIVASTTISLWTSFDERWIELTLLDSIAGTSPGDAAVRIGAWQATASAWFRGVLASGNFQADYQEGLKRNEHKVAALNEDAMRNYPHPDE